MSGAMKGIEDMKSGIPVMKMAICKIYKDMDKNMMSELMICKSAELKDVLTKAKALCASQKPVTTKPGSTRVLDGVRTKPKSSTKGTYLIIFESF